MLDATKLKAILDKVPRLTPEGKESTLELLAVKVGTDRSIADLLKPDAAEAMALAYHPKYSLRPIQRIDLDNAPTRTVWASMGRGAGKTHAMSSDIIMSAMDDPNMRAILVAPTLRLARLTNIEGPSGIITLSPPWFKPEYRKSDRVLIFPNGARLEWHGSDALDDKLRGTNASRAYLDEPVSYNPNTAAEALNEVYRVLRVQTPRMERLGIPVKVLICSTPKPSAVFGHLLETQGSDLSIINGTPRDNWRNLEPSYLAYLESIKNTPQGLMEYWGILSFDSMIGAPVFQAGIFSKHRAKEPRERYDRIIVSIDPATSDPSASQGKDKRRDKTGLCVVGLWKNDKGVVNADILVSESFSRDQGPDAWGKRAAELHAAWAPHADRCSILADITGGAGVLVRSQIRKYTQAPYKPLNLRGATKLARLEAVSSMFSAGLIRLVGRHPALEAQLSRFTTEVGTHGADDLADAAAIPCFRYVVRKSKAVANPDEATEEEESEE